jgi:hypothetical protein
MESMVKEPEFEHLTGLNRFRNYLLATQWDLSRRELVGRSLSEAGYIRVQTDVLSYAERINLLRYLLTLDALEIGQVAGRGAAPRATSYSYRAASSAACVTGCAADRLAR